MRLRSKLPVVAVAPALLALAGLACTVGPDYERPRIELPEGWIGAAYGDAPPPTTNATTQQSAAVHAAADVARWWTTLDDPVLDTLIERAIESNLDLQQASARIRQARGSRGVARAGLLPAVNTNARYSRSGSGAGDDDDGGGFDGGGIITLPDGTVVTRPGGGGGENRSSQRNNLRAGLDAAWELDIFGGIRRDVEAADAQLQFAIEDWRDVLVILVSEVALNYIDPRTFQRQIDIAERNLAAQVRTTDVIRRRAAVGVISRLDLAQAEAQVAATRSGIPSLRTAERQAAYNLGVLLGREPGALAGELAHDAPLPPVPAEVPVGLPSELLRRRPDVRRAEAAAHAATARIGVATADLFPRFTLTAGLGIQGDRFDALGDRRNYFWSYGPSVSWPLFDANRIRSNIRVQEASQEEALLAYRGTILLALQEVENALVAYANEQERREQLTRAVEANRRAVSLSSELYQRGQVEFLDLLNSQRSLLASEDALVQSNSTVVTNLIALYKALGGGWEEPAQ